jgi:hypothetical protein
MLIDEVPLAKALGALFYLILTERWKKNIFKLEKDNHLGQIPLKN